MNIKRIIVRNVACNWAGTAVQMVCGFVVAPFLIYKLGAHDYGLWILIASMTGYFDLLDLGVRGSLGRNIAFHLARNDAAGVNAVASTGLALLCGAAALVLPGTVCLLPVFTRVFDVPDAEAAGVRLALLLVSLNLTLTFLINVFDAVLWAHQRFDLGNAIDVPLGVLRTALTFCLVDSSDGLVTLAVITLTVTVLSGLAKVVVVRRVVPGLRLRPACVSREAARGLFGFGIWCFLQSVARTATNQAGPLLIGSRLAVDLVAPYNPAVRLVAYVNTFLLTGTGVLTPLMTALHAEGKHNQQRALFVQGGKYCLAGALFFLGLFYFLGEPLLGLWITHRLDEAARRPFEVAPLLLTILMLGEVLPLSQYVTQAMVLGMDRHRVGACMSLLETGLVVGLALALLPAHGLVGVCVAIAVAGALCRGLVPLVYACRLQQVSLGQYTAQAVLPAVAAAGLPAVGLALLVGWRVPESWPALVAYSAAYGLAFLAAAGVLLVGYERLKAWRLPFRGKALPQLQPEPAAAGVSSWELGEGAAP